MSDFDDLTNDSIMLVNAAGEASSPMRCHFSPNKVRVFSESLDVEEGQQLLRVLPNGKKEPYTILEVNFTSGMHGIPSSYALAVRKDASLLPGSNARTTNVSIRHSHGFQVGDHNVQNIVAAFTQVVHEIEVSTAPAAEKREAKDKLRAFLAHPLVSAVLGGASGGLLEILKKAPV